MVLMVVIIVTIHGDDDYIQAVFCTFVVEYMKMQVDLIQVRDMLSGNALHRHSPPSLSTIAIYSMLL